MVAVSYLTDSPFDDQQHFCGLPLKGGPCLPFWEEVHMNKYTKEAAMTGTKFIAAAIVAVFVVFNPNP